MQVSTLSFYWREYCSDVNRCWLCSRHTSLRIFHCKNEAMFYCLLSGMASYDHTSIWVLICDGFRLQVCLSITMNLLLWNQMLEILACFVLNLKNDISPGRMELIVNDHAWPNRTINIYRLFFAFTFIGRTTTVHRQDFYYCYSVVSLSITRQTRRNRAASSCEESAADRFCLRPIKEQM